MASSWCRQFLHTANSARLLLPGAIYQQTKALQQMQQTIAAAVDGRWAMHRWGRHHRCHQKASQVST